MKVLSGTARKQRGGASGRAPATRPARPPAKPTQAAAARKIAAPAKAKAAKPAEKPSKPPQAKAGAVAKAAAPKPPIKPVSATRIEPKPEVSKPPVAGAPVEVAKPPAVAQPAPVAPAPVAPQADRRPPVPERIPPRPPAKPEIFVEGDHVVYPTHGVGKVERIAIEEIAGHKLELIHITFEENRMTLRVPVAKARSAGLRKLATRKLFDEALAVLKGRARIKRTMWSRRAQEYEAKINSGDPLAIAEVVRDLHRNAGQPDQSFSERQIYEAAMDRLSAELAALDKTDKLTAATKLTNFLKTV